MAKSCLLYYITDRNAFSGDERTRRSRLLDKIAEASRAGIDFIQLREKDLSIHELEALALDSMETVRQASTRAPGRAWTALLINSRTDVALAASADGVHLRGDDVSPQDVRKVWQSRNFNSAPLVGVSCHSSSDVVEAAKNGATFAVVAPVFGKKDAPATATLALDALSQACLAEIPVLALGGVTLQNAASCLNAGASGIAGIRLFQENDIAEVVHALRGQ